MLRLRRRQGRARFLAMRRGGAALVPLTPPVLTWTSGTATYNPTFNLTQIALSYKTRLRIVSIDGVADGTIYTDSDTVSLSEATFGTLSVDTFPTLAYSKAYAIDGAYSPDGGATWSPWSNTVSKAMAAAPTEFIIDPLNGTALATLYGNAAPTGGTWTQYPGLGGAIYYDGAGGIYPDGGASVVVNSAVPTSPNYYVEGTLTYLSSSGSAYFAIGGRATGTDFNWFEATWSESAGKWRLWDLNNGNFELMGEVAGTFASGSKVVRLSMNANQISLYLDGALIIGPITNNNHGAAGKVIVWGEGAMSTTAGMHLTDIKAGYL